MPFSSDHKTHTHTQIPGQLGGHGQTKIIHWGACKVKLPTWTAAWLQISQYGVAASWPVLGLRSKTLSFYSKHIRVIYTFVLYYGTNWSYQAPCFFCCARLDCDSPVLWSAAHLIPSRVHSFILKQITPNYPSHVKITQPFSRDVAYQRTRNKFFSVDDSQVYITVRVSIHKFSRF